MDFQGVNTKTYHQKIKANNLKKELNSMRGEEGAQSNLKLYKNIEWAFPYYLIDIFEIRRLLYLFALFTPKQMVP